MGPDLRAQLRADAEARRKRRRRALIRDAVLAFAIACALVGAWELVDWLALIGMSDLGTRGPLLG